MSARRIALVSAATAALAAGLLLTTHASAEEPVTLTGHLVVAHEDDFEGHRSRHVYGLETAEGRTELRFADEDRAHALSGREVRVRGERRGGVVEVVAAEDLGPAESPTTTDALPAGAINVAVVVFGYEDQPFEVSAQQVGELVFGGGTWTGRTVGGYYDAISYGRQPVRGTVLDAGQLAGVRSTDTCSYTTWGEQARAKVLPDPSPYTHVAHVMPPNPNCQFGGVAYLPGTYSWTITGPIGDVEQLQRRFRGIMSHELGHNVGAHHGGSYTCTDRSGAVVTLSSKCTLAEYGDPFTVMGTSWGERHFNAHQKGSISSYAVTVARQAWLDEADTRDVTTTETYLLSSLEAAGDGTQVLRIPKPGSRTDSYYVELRDGTGYDAGEQQYLTSQGALLTNPAAEGLTIRIAGAYATRGISRLLDTTPGSPAGFHDAALAVGAEFADPAGVSVRHDGFEGTRARVTVTITSRTKGRK